VKNTVAGDDRPTRELGVASVEVSDAATGFPHEQDAGGEVPRIEEELPECIEASTGDVGEVERGRPRTTDSGDDRHESPELPKVIEEIYRYPLRQTAVDTLNRQLRSGISDQDLASLVIALRQEERLCLIHEEEQAQEPKIICSRGLAKKG